MDHQPRRPATCAARPGSVERSAALFRALSDPGRLTILKHLALGEHRVVELTEHLGLAQSTTSAHLAVLREAGLVNVSSDGRASVHALAVPAEVAALLGAAERALAAIGPCEPHPSAGRRQRETVERVR